MKVSWSDRVHLEIWIINVEISSFKGNITKDVFLLVIMMVAIIQQQAFHYSIGYLCLDSFLSNQHYLFPCCDACTLNLPLFIILFSLLMPAHLLSSYFFSYSHATTGNAHNLRTSKFFFLSPTLSVLFFYFLLFSFFSNLSHSIFALIIIISCIWVRKNIFKNVKKNIGIFFLSGNESKNSF